MGLAHGTADAHILLPAFHLHSYEGKICAGVAGESEAKVRQLFREAAELAPCIVFIDEIDAIAGKRESAQREMERRIVAQARNTHDTCTFPTLYHPLTLDCSSHWNLPAPFHRHY